MAQEGIANTGTLIIDALQGLQLKADQATEFNRKVAVVKEGLGLVAARQLIGREFWVSSVQAFGKRPDDEGYREYFKNEIFFMGRLASYTYLADPDVPVDSLAVNFIDPTVMGAEPDSYERIRQMTLQVPVLAIDSCHSAEAA